MPDFKSQEDLDAYIVKLESDMREAAKRFEFEKAAKLPDTIKELRTKEFLFPCLWGGTNESRSPNPNVEKTSLG
jgi:hypothetical protein